jgi:hypothetical protein
LTAPGGVLLLACLAAGSTGRTNVASPFLVWPTGISERCAGDVVLNRTPARYALVTLPHGGQALARLLISQGWRETRPSASDLVGPTCAVTVRTYRQDGHLLLAAVPGGDASWAVLAVVATRPGWSGVDHDAPGREPLGLPRFGGAHRLLHVAGHGFEAACYRSSASPRSLLAEAGLRLGAAGWTVSPVAASGLAANRSGAPPVALMSESNGTGSSFMVLAGALIP